MKMELINKKILITGGAGFIGSNIADKMISMNNRVLIYDNFSTGNHEFLKGIKDKVEIIKGDLLDTAALEKALKNVDFVFHMAANADVRDNVKEPTKCLYQNTTATSNLLEAMRKNNVKSIALASTGSVYGEPDIFPTPENAPFPIQTSMYGASKLACEGLLQAYSSGFDFNIFIFRFVSLMGERYTHGCIFDFYKKLLKDPKNLEILGNGKQRKSYLYVKDCIDAMVKVVSNSKEKINIYNLGHDDYIEVTPIAQIICKELGLKDVKFSYSGGERGWIGDSPFIHLDISKLKKLGWKPTLSIPECVKKTIIWLRDNQWALNKKSG